MLDAGADARQSLVAQSFPVGERPGRSTALLDAIGNPGLPAQTTIFLTPVAPVAVELLLGPVQQLAQAAELVLRAGAYCDASPTS